MIENKRKRIIRRQKYVKQRLSDIPKNIRRKYVGKVANELFLSENQIYKDLSAK